MKHSLLLTSFFTTATLLACTATAAAPPRTIHEVDHSMGRFDFARRPQNAHCQRAPIIPLYAPPSVDCTFDANGRPNNATAVSLSGPFDYDSGDGFNAYGVQLAIIDNGLGLRPNNDLKFSLQYAAKAGQVLMHIAAYSGTVPDGLARISVTFRRTLGGGALVAALQVQDAGGAWHDHASAVSEPFADANRYWQSQTMVAEGTVDPSTPVRLELRAEASVSEVLIEDAHLTTEECVPDQDNPGHCL